MNKYVICVDFDGVLHSYRSGWKGATEIPDPPVEGAMSWLIHVAEDDRFELMVYSSRSKEPGGIEAMKEWICSGLKQWMAQDGYKEPDAERWSGYILGRMGFPTQKPAASMTIDDRAFCFRGEFPTTYALLAFQPWTKVGRPTTRFGVHRPSRERIAEIREALLDTIDGTPPGTDLDSADNAIAELLTEIDHLDTGLG